MATYIKMLTATGLACTVLGLSGCGPDSQASSGNAGKPTLSIQAPSDGANVELPITLKFTTSEDIGPTDSGKDHVHVFVDGKTNEYTVVTSTTYQIKSLPMGRHIIGVTLQHADHSPAGASAQVSVNVTGGSSGGGSSDSTGGGNGGYGY
ncbi:hypothetical protein GCM10023191_040090 [Actinoallomurus oryzae]|uniref:Lipoprotein n=1 Tax=Actinoallomurus oryzae TaxID=502180 RepID=A0ABP8Q2U5_9ACTN